jgi:predicted transcriptional regulator
MNASSDLSRSLTGDELLAVFLALANPHRLRVLALLTGGRNYVSQIAREIHISRPLLHIHLRKLEHAGLVSSVMEFSDDGKALKYYEVVPFSLSLTPDVLATAAATVTFTETKENHERG